MTIKLGGNFRDPDKIWCQYNTVHKKQHHAHTSTTLYQLTAKMKWYWHIQHKI